MSQFKQIPSEQFEEVLNHAPKSKKNVVEYVQRSGTVSLGQLANHFSDMAKDVEEMLSIIGQINNVIWVKCKSAIYPIEACDDTEQSIVTLGQVRSE